MEDLVNVLDSFYANIDFLSRILHQHDTEQYKKDLHVSTPTKCASVMVLTIIPIGIVRVINCSLSNVLANIFAVLLVVSFAFLLTRIIIARDKARRQLRKDIENYRKWMKNQSEWQEFKVTDKKSLIPERLFDVDEIQDIFNIENDIIKFYQLKGQESIQTTSENGGVKEELRTSFEGIRVDFNSSIELDNNEYDYFVEASNENDNLVVRLYSYDTNDKLLCRRASEHLYNQISEMWNSICMFAEHINSCTSQIKLEISSQSGIASLYVGEDILTRMRLREKVEYCNSFIGGLVH
jgi:type IV secretory pathway VirB3-like protein